MCSAGIYDENVKKDYLRYCQNYYCAFTPFVAQICEVLSKYEGKKITKRIDTAIKSIDSRLSFRIEKSTYGEGGYIYLCWHDYEGRIFRDEATGQWNYVKDMDYILMQHVDSMESFDSNKFIEALNNRAKYYTEERERVYYALDNLESIKEEYNAARAAFIAARDKIPSAISHYYNCNTSYVSEWR